MPNARSYQKEIGALGGFIEFVEDGISIVANGETLDDLLKTASKAGGKNRGLIRNPAFAGS